MDPYSWNTYRKTKPVHAKKMTTEFTVKTLEGMMRGYAGDYLVMDEPRTHEWPVACAVFEVTHTLDETPATIPSAASQDPADASADMDEEASRDA